MPFPAVLDGQESPLLVIGWTVSKEGAHLRAQPISILPAAHLCVDRRVTAGSRCPTCAWTYGTSKPAASMKLM